MIEQLMYHGYYRCWRGYFTFPSHRVVKVSIDWGSHSDGVPHYDSEDFEESFELVKASTRSTLLWLRANEQELHTILANEMLELYNETWNTLPPITVQDLTNRIRFRQISLELGQKSFSLNFSDDTEDKYEYGYFCQFDENRRFVRGNYIE